MNSKVPTAFTTILFCSAPRPRRPKRYLRKRWKELKTGISVPWGELTSFLPEFQKFSKWWTKKKEDFPSYSTLNPNSFTSVPISSPPSTFSSLLKSMDSLSNRNPTPPHRPMGLNVISSARRFPPPPMTTPTTPFTSFWQSARSTFTTVPFSTRLPSSLPSLIPIFSIPFMFHPIFKLPKPIASTHPLTKVPTQDNEWIQKGNKVSVPTMPKTPFLPNKNPVVKPFLLRKSRTESSIQKLHGNPEMQIVEYASIKSLIACEGIEAMMTTTSMTAATMTQPHVHEHFNPSDIQRKRVEVKKRKQSPKRQKKTRLNTPFTFRRTILSMIEEEELEEKIPGAWVWGFY